MRESCLVKQSILRVDEADCWERFSATSNTMLILVSSMKLADAQKRKSKWDSAIPVTTIAQPTILTTTATLPGVVTVTTSASGSKTTVISAVGTIVKKAKQWPARWAWIFGLNCHQNHCSWKEGVAFTFGKWWQDSFKQTTALIWRNGGRSKACQLCVHTNGPLPKMPLFLLQEEPVSVLCWRKMRYKFYFFYYCIEFLSSLQVWFNFLFF